MKADISLADLQRALRGLTPIAASVVRSRYAPPAHLTITVDGPAVTVTAATPAIIARITTGGGIDDGALDIDAAALAAALAAVTPARTRRSAIVHLAAEPGNLHVTGATTVTLPTHDPKPATAAPDMQEELLRLPAGQWLSTLTAVARAADRRRGEVANAIRLHRPAGGCLDVEATDRMRVHRITLGDPHHQPYESRLPVATVKLLITVLRLADPAGEAVVGYSGDTVICTAAGITVTVTAAAHGSWPDLQRVLEASIEPGHTFTTGTTDLRDAIHRARMIVDRYNPQIDLNLDPAAATVTLTVPGRDRPMLTHVVAVTGLRGDRTRFAIRADHAADLLAGITDEHATLNAPDGANLLSVAAVRTHAVLIRYPRPTPPATSI
jgi:hypothetical protein